MNERPNFTELTAFAAIARRRSFRAAADELGLSASTLSHMMRALETRLGLRLFNRTTRSVAPTEAGEAFLASLTPILRDLDHALVNVGRLRAEPSGTLRINASRHAASLLLEHVTPRFLAANPLVRLDLVTEGRLVDIVAEGFDAGVRLGEAVPQDMVAVRFGGEARFVAIASPAYLEEHETPRTPDDLDFHACIRFRLPSGKIYRWEFERHGQAITADVGGALTLDDPELMVRAAAQGLGVAFVPIGTARAALADGEVRLVLQEWSPGFPGHFLYYPGHRLPPPALRAFINALRESDFR
ncbi:MAG: LysR family transcriptional regulator [Caulobacteraceae bacterium]